MLMQVDGLADLYTQPELRAGIRERLREELDRVEGQRLATPEDRPIRVESTGDDRADIHPLAREVDPETFRVYDGLIEQRDARSALAQRSCDKNRSPTQKVSGCSSARQRRSRSSWKN